LQGASSNGRGYSVTGSKRPSSDVRFCPKKDRSGSEGTLGKVEGGTTAESGVTIAQLLTGLGGSANRNIGGKTQSSGPMR